MASEPKSDSITEVVEVDPSMEQEDQSSGIHEFQPDVIPRATVEQWFQTSKRSLSQFEELESRTQKVVEAHNFDWQDALRDISSSLFEEMQMLREMNKSLATLLEGGRRDSKGTINSHNGDETRQKEENEEEKTEEHEDEKQEEIEISIADICRIPWLEAAKLSSPPYQHFAIEIPYSEPSLGEIQALVGSNAQLALVSTGDAADRLPTTTLPERIRINGHRLKNFLDYEFCNGELSYNGRTPLAILRPFKLLVYFDEAIRAKVTEFEAVRKERHDLPEEEYLKGLSELTVEDKGYSKEDWRGMSVPELTALIMDCRCLTRFMDETIRPAQAHLATGPETVRFADLWFLFPQGSLVYIKGSSPPQKIWMVVQRTGGRRILETPGRDEKGLGNWTAFVLDCYYLDFDGARFIPVFRQFEIGGFDGTQAVKSLPVLPLPVAEREGLTDRAYLTARGEQFFNCTQNVLHLDYSGRCHYLDPSGRKLTDLVDKIPRSASCYSEQIDSDVIVDFTRALGEIPWWRPVAGEHVFGETDSLETGTETGVDKDGVWDKRFRDDFMETQTRKWESWAKTGGGPTGDDLLILPDRVYAFVLSTRRWGTFPASSLNNARYMTNQEDIHDPNSLSSNWKGAKWERAAERETQKRQPMAQTAPPRWPQGARPVLDSLALFQTEVRGRPFRFAEEQGYRHLCFTYSPIFPRMLLIA